MLHDGTSGVGALGFSSNHHQGSHFASGTAGDIGNMNDNFHDTSQVEIGHNAAQGQPNPRSEYPLCVLCVLDVYVHVVDLQGVLTSLAHYTDRHHTRVYTLDCGVICMF